MEFPVVVLCTRSHVALVGLDTKSCGLEFCFELCCGCQDFISALSNDNRDDNNLGWCNGCRKDKTFVISVDGDDCGKTSLGDTEAGLGCKLLLTVDILIGDVEGLCEVVA